MKTLSEQFVINAPTCMNCGKNPCECTPNTNGKMVNQIPQFDKDDVIPEIEMEFDPCGECPEPKTNYIGQATPASATPVDDDIIPELEMDFSKPVF